MRPLRLQEAIACNNDGALCLATSRHDPRRIGLALHLFHRALKILRGEHVATETSTTEPANDLEEPSDDSSRTGCTEPFVYRRPLLLSFESLARKCAVSMFHVTLAFNLALTCHLKGDATGCDAPLRRAMDVYQVLGRTIHAIDTVWLRGLVLNNLACLYYERCEYEACQECLHGMHQIEWISMATSGWTVSLCPHEREEIILNGLYLGCPPTAAQAA